MYCTRSAPLAVDHRVCFRPIHHSEFQRQSQVAAAAAAAVAGFSAFNLHSSAVDGADRSYYLSQGQLSKSTQRNSLARYCVDDVGSGASVADRRTPADAAVTGRYLQVAPSNSKDNAVLHRTYP